MEGAASERYAHQVRFADSPHLHRTMLDNSPGHEGSAYDDTYSKRVKWSIAWEVTIEDQRVLVGEPTATVSGIASADKNSGYGLGSCSGPVKLPVVSGKTFIPTTFDVIERTPQFLTVRMGGTGAFGSFPVAWAASPSCLASEFITGYVTSPSNGAGTAWGKSWGAPEFKIALFNNYKITPVSIGNTYPFPVELPIKKIVFDWNARLAIAGSSNAQPTAPAKPTPPPKKPCTPTASTLDPFLDDRSANIYLNELAGAIPWSQSGQAPPWDSAKYLKELEAKFGGPVDKESFGVWLTCAMAFYQVGARGAPMPLPYENGGKGTGSGDVLWIPQRLPGDPPYSYEGPPPDRPPYPYHTPEFDDVDVTISPDLMDVQVQLQSGRGTGGASSTNGTGGTTKIGVTFNAAGVRALRSGRPFAVTRTATFRAKGKPPTTATKKITLQGPPPVAAISSVTFSGTPQNPSIIVHGTNLGSKPGPNPAASPSNQPLCPVTINGNAGLDYGTSLYLADDARRMAAGRYRPEINELDCIGLIVTKFTPTEVDYRFGAYYAQVYPKYPLAAGDSIEVGVNGATKTVHVKYGTTVSN
jgi:hypothetical protein